MSDADLYLLKEAIKLVESKVYRDYIELGNLQTTSRSVQFLNKTVEFLNQKFFDFFKEKRPNYSIFIKDFKTNKNQDDRAENSIYINSICGLNNLLHHIHYFVTIISLFSKGKVVASVVNNYSMNEMFVTVKNKGVFLNDRKVRVSGRSINDNSLIGIKCDKDRKNFIKLITKLPVFRVSNCAVLDSCYTTCGRYDANIIFDCDEREVNSCELFVIEAGGLSCRISDNSILLSNSIIYEDLRKIVMEND